MVEHTQEPVLKEAEATQATAAKPQEPNLQLDEATGEMVSKK